MTHDDGKPSKLPEPFTGALSVIDFPVLRAYVEDISRWVIGEAVGGRLPREQCEAMAGEIAVILAGGLAPELSREIAGNTEKVVAASQEGPVSFDWQGRMTVDGVAVPDLVILLDAVGRLLDHGLGEALDTLHDSHRRVLFDVHDEWSARQRHPNEGP